MRHRASAVKDEIRQRIDLTEVVSAHVALRKAGRQYKGLCPFHQERTPSFHVDPDRGLFYCFGCQAGGDVFDFVMRIGSQTFPEALETLAARAGVALPAAPEEAEERSEREALLRALAAATRFFREQLAASGGRGAREYLARRGVESETVDHFGLGYAPPGWDGLLRSLRGKGFPAELLERASLVSARPGGDGFFDLFRHRLMFPILDLQDRTVGFGGRALDDGTPKYLNSRESAAFNKGRLLYALQAARGAIREHGTAVVVEGYTDVLACHQAGITNAVASLGTALTADHVAVLRRFAAEAVVVYDADQAGRLASERGLALFEEAELPVRIAVLPPGRDPDAFIRDRGIDEFRTILDHALTMFEFRIDLAAERHDMGTIEGRVAVADELLPVIASVSNPVRQSEYLRTVAQRFDLSEDALRQRLASRRRPGQRAEAVRSIQVASPSGGRERAERLLVQAMVHSPEDRGVIARELSAEDFLEPVYRKLAEALLADDAPALAVREQLTDPESVALFTRLLFEPLPAEEQHWGRVLAETIAFLRERAPAEEERRRLTRALQAAQQAGDEQEVRKLQEAYLSLIAEPRRRAGGAPE